MPLQIPSPRSRKHARIEIIPLIDIVFFLLATFVMVSLSMVKNKGIPVHLPVASSGTPQDRKDYHTVTLTERGEIYLNKQLISLEDLDGALKGVMAGNPEPRVFINGDTKAEFGRAIEVLDHLRRLGITKIAIETKPPATSASAAPSNAAPANAVPVGTPPPAAPASPGTPEPSLGNPGKP